jgi:hypothetical protein
LKRSGLSWQTWVCLTSRPWQYFYHGSCATSTDRLDSGRLGG